MININWQQVAAYALIGLSGIGGIGGLIYGLNEWRKLRWRGPSNTVQTSRSADEAAPIGAVEWVADICEAMGAASAESKLEAILAGYTRDQARRRRIAELESGGGPRVSATAMNLSPRVIQEAKP